MSEQTPPPGGGQDQPPLIVNAQYVRDLSFEAPHAPAIFTEMRTSPEISISVDVQPSTVDEARKIYEVRLKLNAEGKVGDKPAFIAELDYGAAVTLNCPEEHTYPLLMIEAPRLMFPFARSILANLTRDGGFPPVVLQPIDFVSLFRQRVEAMRQSRAGQDGTGATAPAGEESAGA